MLASEMVMIVIIMKGVHDCHMLINLIGLEKESISKVFNTNKNQNNDCTSKVEREEINRQHVCGWDPMRGTMRGNGIIMIWIIKEAKRSGLAPVTALINT